MWKSTSVRTLLVTVQGIDVAYLSPLEKKKKKVIDEAGRRDYINSCRQIVFMGMVVWKSGMASR